MTRNLPEPSPKCSVANEWRRKLHAELEDALNDADLHKKTGELHLVAQLNEGGVRAASVGIRKIIK